MTKCRAHIHTFLPPEPDLTHLPLDKMAAISQTIFSDAFSWMNFFCILIKMSLNFVLKDSIDTNAALVQVMAWHWIGDKPLSEPMMFSLLTYMRHLASMSLTHWGQVMHISVSKLCYLRFRLCLVTCSASSHYLNQCWVIVNWTIRNKLQENFHRNSHYFIEQNALESVICKMEAILSQPQSVTDTQRTAGSPLLKWACTSWGSQAMFN